MTNMRVDILNELYLSSQFCENFSQPFGNGVANIQLHFQWCIMHIGSALPKSVIL